MKSYLNPFAKKKKKNLLRNKITEKSFTYRKNQPSIRPINPSTNNLSVNQIMKKMFKAHSEPYKLNIHI